MPGRAKLGPRKRRSAVARLSEHLAIAEGQQRYRYLETWLRVHASLTAPYRGRAMDRGVLRASPQACRGYNSAHPHGIKGLPASTRVRQPSASAALPWACDLAVQGNQLHMARCDPDNRRLERPCQRPAIVTVESDGADGGWTQRITALAMQSAHNLPAFVRRRRLSSALLNPYILSFGSSFKSPKDFVQNVFMEAEFGANESGADYLSYCAPSFRKIARKSTGWRKPSPWFLAPTFLAKQPANAAESVRAEELELFMHTASSTCKPNPRGTADSACER